MSDKNDLKWNIPYGISYEKLTKIVRVLLQKKGDINEVSLDTLIQLTSLLKNYLSTNLSFLKSINIVCGDNIEGYKLTELGKKYVDALHFEKDEDIKKYSLELITESHLNDLKIYIETEESKLSKDGILKFIKKNARIADGASAGNMPKQSSQGAHTLMEIFNKAGIISAEILSTQMLSKSSINSKPAKKKNIGSTNKNKNEIKPKEDNFTLSSDSFSIQISKKIDLNDLEFIKSQILALFEHVKKKIKDSKIEKNNIDTN